MVVEFIVILVAALAVFVLYVTTSRRTQMSSSFRSAAYKPRTRRAVSVKKGDVVARKKTRKKR